MVLDSKFSLPIIIPVLNFQWVWFEWLHVSSLCSTWSILSLKIFEIHRRLQFRLNYCCLNPLCPIPSFCLKTKSKTIRLSLSFYFSKNERFYQRSNEIGLIFEKYFLIDHVSKSRKMRFPLALEWLTVSKSLRPSTNQHLVSLIAPISTQTIQFWSESLRFFSNWVKRENASGNAEIIFTLG